MDQFKGCENTNRSVILGSWLRFYFGDNVINQDLPSAGLEALKCNLVRFLFIYLFSLCSAVHKIQMWALSCTGCVVSLNLGWCVCACVYIHCKIEKTPPHSVCFMSFGSRIASQWPPDRLSAPLSLRALTGGGWISWLVPAVAQSARWGPSHLHC